MHALPRVVVPLLAVVVCGAGMASPVAANGPFRPLPHMPGRPFYHSYYNSYFFPGFSYGSPFFSPYSYYLPPGWGIDSYGYLKGTAEVIDAQGRYLKNVEDAYLLREKVKAAQLDNRRKTYEQWLWERGNVPTLNQERERAQQDEVRRSQTNPPPTEVWSGYSLNVVLAHAQELLAKGIEGPEVRLDPEVLRQINVISKKNLEAPALLREAGKVHWPAGLENLTPAAPARELRTQVDALLVEGKRQALLGKVDAGLLRELDRCLDRLKQLLAAKVEEYSFNDYVEAKRVLRQLDDAAAVLREADAADYLNGRYAARGATVKDLLDYMTRTGIRFAPSASGQEAAYNALHQALVQYDRQASTKAADK